MTLYPRLEARIFRGALFGRFVVGDPLSDVSRGEGGKKGNLATMPLPPLVREQTFLGRSMGMILFEE